MPRTFDTPVTRSAWESTTDGDPDDYSGIDLTTPSGEIFKLTNAEASEVAQRLTEASAQAASRADEAIRRLAKREARR